jgi:hypothetical protein
MGSQNSRIWVERDTCEVLLESCSGESIGNLDLRIQSKTCRKHSNRYQNHLDKLIQLSVVLLTSRVNYR